MSMSKVAMVGVGAVIVGAGIYFLSRDSVEQQYNPKIHTDAILHNLLDDMYLEYACGYVFYYNMILNLKQENSLTSAKLMDMEETIKGFTSQKDEQICKKYQINQIILEEWLESKKKDKQVERVLRDIVSLHDQVLVQQNLKSFDFNLPESMTREKYIQVIRKVLACVRHKAYSEVQEILKKEAKEKISREEMEKLLHNINDLHQEDYRKKSLDLFQVQIPGDEQPKKLMQKAYLVFSTVSSLGDGSRSHWEDQVTKEQKDHSNFITKIALGERLEGIESDPLLSDSNDYAYEYNAIPGYMQRQQTTTGDVTLKLQPHDQSLKNVQDFMLKSKERAQQRIAEKHSQEASQVDTGLKESQEDVFNLSKENSDKGLVESQEVTVSQSN